MGACLLGSYKVENKVPKILEIHSTVKFGNKERFDKEQIGIKKPFPVTNLPVYFIRIRSIWH